MKNVDRRSFLVGSLSVVFISSLPSIAFASYENDIQDVVAICHDKFLSAKYQGEWLYMFQEEIEKKMKQWRTYQPLKELTWGNGDRQGQGCGIWTNPNFFDECHFVGSVELEGKRYYTDGFTVSFKLPNDQTVKTTYNWYDKEFNIKRI